MQLTPELRGSYEELFASCVPAAARSAEIARLVARMREGEPRYQAVASACGETPWVFVAAVHLLESGGRWTSHLHNGDPLTARTVRVPAGRPAAGEAPFPWEASAIDALRLRRLDVAQDWSLAGLLWQLEGYNGFGYRKRGVLSPYLWSGSNHYEQGKFVADGTFDAEAVSKQTGAAVLLKAGGFR